MNKKVIVWGTGNVGRPAIRAVQGHRALDLVGTVVANPAKIGQDAGTIAGIEPTGVTATDQWQELLEQELDAVVYTATADIRPEEAFNELLASLKSGANVVSTSFYPFLLPELAPEDSLALVNAACAEGNSSLFISGIDPGWAMDILPVMLTGMGSNITEVRSQEIFNYALYDQPEVVRHVIGFGCSMDETPPMLLDYSLRLVWEPMVRLVAQGLDLKLDEVRTQVERRPLEKTIQVDGMGEFEAGTQGAFRFEVQGIVNGKALIVIEHITRISDDCASDWPYPPEGQGCHQIKIKGSPELTVTIHGEDPNEPGPAGGGNASAANRVVNAIEAVCAAKPGIVTAMDLPPIDGRGQIKV